MCISDRDAENVWGTDVPYLRGKEDPYEAQTSIPNYSWTVTYTWDELTWVLQNLSLIHI